MGKRIRVDDKNWYVLRRVAKYEDVTINDVIKKLLTRFTKEELEKPRVPKQYLILREEKMLLDMNREYSAMEITFSKNVLTFIMINLNGFGYTINIKALIQNVQYHIDFAKKMNWKTAMRDLKEYKRILMRHKGQDPKMIKKELQMIKDKDYELKGLLVKKLIACRNKKIKRINKEQKQRIQFLEETPMIEVENIEE